MSGHRCNTLAHLLDSIYFQEHISLQYFNLANPPALCPLPHPSISAPVSPVPVSSITHHSVRICKHSSIKDHITSRVCEMAAASTCSGGLLTIFGCVSNPFSAQPWSCGSSAWRHCVSVDPYGAEHREGCTARRQHHTLIWQTLDCIGIWGGGVGGVAQENAAKPFIPIIPSGRLKQEWLGTLVCGWGSSLVNFFPWNFKLQWFSSPFRIAIVEMLPHPNNGLFLLGVCSNWEKKDVSVCLCWSLQIGVVTAMTLAEFIMRVSLLLFLGKQACGWRDRHATNEQ